jgi:YD repeat-containing protein
VSGKGSVDASTCTASSLTSRFDYTFDGTGNRLSQVERRTAVGATAAGAAETTEYGYDALDRLVGVKYPDGTATLYRLDPVGNRTGERKTLASKVVALTVAAFAAVSPADASSDLTNSFNRADWLMQQADAKDVSRNAVLGYDLSGNLTTRTKATGTRTFAWDARGALASVSEGGTALGRYDYDATGMRVKRAAASETVEYVLDDGHVLQEADGANGDKNSNPRSVRQPILRRL